MVPRHRGGAIDVKRVSQSRRSAADVRDEKQTLAGASSGQTLVVVVRRSFLPHWSFTQPGPEADSDERYVRAARVVVDVDLTHRASAAERRSAAASYQAFFCFFNAD